MSAITGLMVLSAAGKGDKMCTAILEEVERYLGLGIANIVNLFNPSLVILDKRLASAGPALLDQVTRIVKRQASHHSTEDLAFRFGKLDEQAGVLGIALLAIEEHFEVPELKAPRFMAELPVENVPANY